MFLIFKKKVIYVFLFLFSIFNFSFADNSAPSGPYEYPPIWNTPINTGSQIMPTTISIWAGDTVGPNNYDANPRICDAGEQHCIYLQPGDYIGAFYLGDDSLYHNAGASVWNGNVQANCPSNACNVAMTVYGNNPATSEKDGFSSGEEIRIRVFSWQTRKEYSMPVYTRYTASCPTCLTSNLITWSAMGLYAITNLKSDTTSFDVYAIPEPASVCLGGSSELNLTATTDLIPGNNSSYNFSWYKNQEVNSFSNNSVLTITGTEDLSEDYYLEATDGDSTISPKHKVIFTTSDCPSTYSISGTVQDYAGVKNIQGATVTLNDGSTSTTTTTDSSGNYVFTDVTAGEDYTISVSKNSEPTSNGLESGDLIKLRRHMAGLETISTVGKFISANVYNENYNINNTDLIKLRRRLASLENLYSGIWKFYPSSTNPSLTTSNYLTTDIDKITIASLSSNQTGKDFIGIKMGDVNDSWN